MNISLDYLLILEGLISLAFNAPNRVIELYWLRIICFKVPAAEMRAIQIARIVTVLDRETYESA